MWTGTPTVLSDFSRTHAAEIAAAASCGLITTALPDGTFSRSWLITPLGLAYISEASQHE